jgi:catalase
VSLEQEGPGNCDDGKGDNEHFDDKTSVLFDAVAIILSDEGAKTLSVESAAIDFVRDAFGHLKTIAVDKGGQALLNTANVGHDAGVVDTKDKDAFIAAAKTRQWDREKSVRTSASWHNRQFRRA